MLLYVIYLRMKFNTELILYRVNDTALQADDFFRIGIACIVHDHEGLLVPYRCTTAAASLSSALLDHPCSRHLDGSIRKIIMRHLAVSAMLSLGSSLDLCEMLCTDHRVLEETSCTTHN